MISLIIYTNKLWNLQISLLKLLKFKQTLVYIAPVITQCPVPWPIQCPILWIFEYLNHCFFEILTHWLCHFSTLWLCDLLTNWLINFMTLWLFDSLTLWRIDSLTVTLFESFTFFMILVFRAQLQQFWAWAKTKTGFFRKNKYKSNWRVSSLLDIKYTNKDPRQTGESWCLQVYRVCHET